MVPFLIFAPRGLTDRAVLLLYVIAFVTDYFDGASARHFGTATPLLRKADSAADTIFYLAIAWLIVRRHPQEFSNNATALTVFLISVGLWYAMDAVRWRRPAGFHAYSAKLLSIGLLVWMIVLLGGWRTGHLLSVVLIFGTAAQVDSMVISLLLRHDCPDVPTVAHALRRRREALKTKS